MKRFLRSVCVGAALSAILVQTAFAAEFTDCADHLHDMGLFRGTGQHYELDRAPTRAEAAVMLVRLLGKESEAETLEYSAPFTDLADWQKPYVQYLYQNGLTTGAAADAFQPDSRCTAQMYAAFLLRALGYSEMQGDFIYRDALDFAEQLGLYDPVVVDQEKFLRDHVAAASYTALSVCPKNEEEMLLDRLIGQNAVDGSAAAPYQALFRDYAAYRQDTQEMDELTRFSVHTLYAEPVVLSAETDGLSVEAWEDTVFDLSKPAALTERTVTLSAKGAAEKTVLSACYLANGIQSRRISGSWIKETIDAFRQTRQVRTYGRVPLVYVTRVERPSASTGWVIQCNDLPPAYRELLWPLEAAAGGLQGDGGTQNVLIEHRTAAGRIVSQQISVDLLLAENVTAQPIIVSKLDKTGEQAILVAPVND